MKKKHHIDSWFYAPFLESDKKFVLQAQESEHLVKVFRAAVNDEIIISNGRGLVKKAIIAVISKKQTEIDFTETINNNPTQPNISIAIGFLKGRDLEEVIETCCQMNISDIYVLHTEHSQENKKSNHSKLMQRLDIKSQTALKQANKSWLTKIHDAQDFNQWLNQWDGQIILLDPDGNEKAAPVITEKQCLVIGPEGGLSASEFKAALSKISSKGTPVYPMTLGKTRIRAKTAGIVALGKLC